MIANTLFDTGPFLPQGFSYCPDFISTEEEDRLLQYISTIELHTFVFQGYEAKRRVASFGYDYNFSSRTLARSKDIPNQFDTLLSAVANHIGAKPSDFAELLITEYPPGSVINWHRDAPPFGLIAGISLKTDCIFKLRPHDKEKQGRRSTVSLAVASRSLYVMKDEARSAWEHSTAPVKATRYSITLRTLHR